MDIGVLALQGDVTEHRRAFAELGVPARPVRRPADLAGLDGIVIPGGESTTMSMLLESSGLSDPLAGALAAGLAAFGTCAGMILLASEVVDGRADQRHFGAVDLRVRRNGYGRQAQSFEADVFVDGFDDGPLHAVFIRAPVVEAVGPEAEVLATLGTDAVPVVVRQGPVLVSSFHPELTGDLRLHRMFLSMVGESRPPALVGQVPEKKE